jgi:osmotically-inducible protein OsmY
MLAECPHGLLMNATPNLVSGEVGRAAKDRLRKSSSVVVRTVSCEYEQGVLVLRGRVPTDYCKQLAQQTVTCFPGLTPVVNEIEVVASVSASVPHLPARRVFNAPRLEDVGFRHEAHD